MSNHNPNLTAPSLPGLALRDLFALAALSAIGRPGDFPEYLARDCYLIADAMLAARTSPAPPANPDPQSP